MSEIGCLVVNDSGNAIKATGVANESDSGLIVYALHKAKTQEGVMSINGFKVIATTNDDRVIAFYYE